jgi:hypothetical protein
MIDPLIRRQLRLHVPFERRLSSFTTLRHRENPAVGLAGVRKGFALMESDVEQCWALP